MRPFSRDGQFSLKEHIYNYRHCRARRIVENAFGILAQRWRIYLRPLSGNFDSIVKMIKATTILHNYLCSKGNIISVNISKEISQFYETSWKPLPRFGTRATEEAKNIRAQFVNYFNSEHGSIPWQWDCV